MRRAALPLLPGLRCCRVGAAVAARVLKPQTMDLPMYLQKDSAGLLTTSQPRRETRDHGDVVVFEARLSDASIDSDGDRILPEAWAEAKADGTALCWQHKFDQPIGVWTDIQLRGDHLWGRGEVSQSFELGRQAGAMLLAGGIKCVSVGFRVPNRKSDIVEKEVDFEGKKRRIREIRKADLIECSLVTRGANPAARVSKSAAMFASLRDAGFGTREIEEMIAKMDDASAAAAAKRLFARDADEAPNEREIERALRDVFGLSAREAKTAISKGFRALMKDEGEANASDADERDAAAKDEQVAKKAERDAGVSEAAQRSIEALLASLRGTE